MTSDRKSSYQRVILREPSVEVACDYVLPDYLGEVRKILYTEARAMPLPTYMNGEEASASGGVRFRMVYADAEGQLSSVEFSEDYELRERFVIEGRGEVSANTAVESSSMRLLGPRKISAKARVAVELTLLTDEDVELLGTALEVGEPELAERSVTVLERSISEPCEREYAEGLCELEGAIADEVRVIYESATPAISECHASEGEVCVSGEHRVCALIAVGDGPACLYKKAIPFAETLTLEGAKEGMRASVGIVTPSLKINVTPTDTGSSAVVSLIAEYTAEVSGNGELALVTDGYMTDREVSCEYGEIELTRLLDTGRATDSVRFELAAEELSLESPSEILYLAAEPRVKSVETTPDAVKILAEIRFSGIACEINGEKTAYAPIKHAAEWSFDMPVRTEAGCSLMPRISLSVTSGEGRVIDGGVELSADLCAELELTASESYRRLCRIDAVGEAESHDDKGRILVYYPDGEDTLFSVARRFHTTPRRLAIDNSLTEATLADRSSAASLRGVDKLIIK